MAWGWHCQAMYVGRSDDEFLLARPPAVSSYVSHPMAAAHLQHCSTLLSIEDSCHPFPSGLSGDLKNYHHIVDASIDGARPAEIGRPQIRPTSPILTTIEIAGNQHCIQQTTTMASRTASKALRSSIVQQLASTPAVQRRTFVSAVNAAFKARPSAATVPRAVFAAQQTRGVKTVDFAGHKEVVYGNDRATVVQDL